jgi:hypothetical protein
MALVEQVELQVQQELRGQQATQEIQALMALVDQVELQV